MKKLVRNLTGSFVALLLLAGMFSCSNGDDLDTDDPFVEANIINPANKGGGAAVEISQSRIRKIMDCKRSVYS